MDAPPSAVSSLSLDEAEMENTGKPVQKSSARANRRFARFLCARLSGFPRCCRPTFPDRVNESCCSLSRNNLVITFWVYVQCGWCTHNKAVPHEG